MIISLEKRETIKREADSDVVKGEEEVRSPRVAKFCCLQCVR